MDGIHDIEIHDVTFNSIFVYSKGTLTNYKIRYILPGLLKFFLPYTTHFIFFIFILGTSRYRIHNLYNGNSHP